MGGLHLFKMPPIYLIHGSGFDQNTLLSCMGCKFIMIYKFGLPSICILTLLH